MSLTEKEREMGIKEVAAEYDDAADKGVIKQKVKDIFRYPEDYFDNEIVITLMKGLGVFLDKVVRHIIEDCIREDILQKKFYDITEFICEKVYQTEATITNRKELKEFLTSPEKNGLDEDTNYVINTLSGDELEKLVVTVAEQKNIDIEQNIIAKAADMIASLVLTTVHIATDITKELFTFIIDYVVQEILVPRGLMNPGEKIDPANFDDWVMSLNNDEADNTEFDPLAGKNADNAENSDDA